MPSRLTSISPLRHTSVSMTDLRKDGNPLSAPEH
jgi:hypothetical protein